MHSLINGTRIVTGALIRSLNPDGYNIFSNNGKAAGQSVFHFHMHITPRYFKDDIHFKLNLKQYGASEMRNFADLIGEKLIIILKMQLDLKNYHNVALSKFCICYNFEL